MGNTLRISGKDISLDNPVESGKTTKELSFFPHTPNVLGTLTGVPIVLPAGTEVGFYGDPAYQRLASALYKSQRVWRWMRPSEAEKDRPQATGEETE